MQAFIEVFRFEVGSIDRSQHSRPYVIVTRYNESTLASARKFEMLRPRNESPSVMLMVSWHRG